MSYSLSKLASKEVVKMLASLPTEHRPKIEIAAFAIMPTHFHLLIRQFEEGEISRYLRRLELSYAHYYNKTNKRHGGVFAGRFKSTHPKSVYGFQQVAKYIHLNPVKTNLIKLESLRNYPFTSYYNVFHPVKFITTDAFMDFYRDVEEYEEFLARPQIYPIDEFLDEF